MTQALWVLVRTEVLTLLRMQEVYTFGLLPATIGFPLLMACIALFVSLSPGDSLAVPQQEPGGVSVVRYLERRFEVTHEEDPAKAFEEERVDLAIVEWTHHPRLDAEAELRVKIRARNNAQLGTVTAALRRGMERHRDRQIQAAGGRPEVDRTLARVAVSGSVLDRSLSTLLVCFTLLACYLGCFLIPVRTASERLSGGLEALAVTRTPLFWLFGVRAVVGGLLFTAIGSLPIFMTWVIAGSMLQLSIGLGHILEIVCTVVLVNAVLVAIGLVVNSTRMALYGGSYVVIGIAPALFLPYVVELPWVPLLGFGLPGLGPQIARIAGSMVAFWVLLALEARWVRFDRMLPTGEADE